MFLSQRERLRNGSWKSAGIISRRFSSLMGVLQKCDTPMREEKPETIGSDAGSKLSRSREASRKIKFSVRGRKLHEIRQ